MFKNYFLCISDTNTCNGFLGRVTVGVVAGRQGDGVVETARSSAKVGSQVVGIGIHGQRNTRQWISHMSQGDPPTLSPPCLTPNPPQVLPFHPAPKHNAIQQHPM